MALKILLDFSLIACRNQKGDPAAIADQEDDADGSGTLEALKFIWQLAGRITGNGDGSLGLHPAVYFYGPSGQHQSPMFMGTASLIKKKLLNNDPTFFRKFNERRPVFEKTLVEHKSLIAMILQGYVSKHRVKKSTLFLDNLIEHAGETREITTEKIISLSGLSGKIFVGPASSGGQDFR